MSIDEEAFDVGRKIAVVARKNKALYQTVKQVAKQKGKKMNEVLAEALELWRLYQTLEDVDPKALVSAIAFVEHMMGKAVEMLVSLGAVFSSEFVKANLGLARELIEAQAPPQEVHQQEVHQQKPAAIDMMKEQMRLTMMQTMMPLMTQMLQQVMAMVGSQGSKQIIPPAQPQPTAKTNVLIEE